MATWAHRHDAEKRYRPRAGKSLLCCAAAQRKSKTLLDQSASKGLGTLVVVTLNMSECQFVLVSRSHMSHADASLWRHELSMPNDHN